MFNWILHYRPLRGRPFRMTAAGGWDSETRNQNPESRIQKTESRNQNPESRKQNPESRIQNLENRIWKVFNLEILQNIRILDSGF